MNGKMIGTLGASLCLALAWTAGANAQERGSQDRGSQEQREQEAREQAAREQAAWEQAAREQQQREQAAREQQRKRIENARAEQQARAQERARENVNQAVAGDKEVIFRQFKAEESKHRDRVARIGALRRVANARGNGERVAELDSLLARENERYSEWIRRTRSALGREEFEVQRARLEGRAVRTPEGAPTRTPQ